MNLPEKPNFVAVDVEASGLHPDDNARISSVGITWQENGEIKTAAYPFDQGKLDKLPQNQQELWKEENPNLGKKEWEQLTEWLSRKALIFHNAKYDLTMLKAGTRHWSGKDLSKNFWYDTMLGSQDLDPTKPAGLNAAAQREGLEGKSGQDQLKEWCKKAKHPHRYDLAPWEIVKPYLIADVEQTYQLWAKQQFRYMNGEGDQKRLAREHQLLATLLQMEWRGVKYNTEESLKTAKKLTQRADQLEEKMPFNCSINEAKQWFYGEQKLQPDRKTEKGNPTLDEEQIVTWIAKGIEWAPEYLEINKSRRAVSMWYQGYPDKIGLDGRLRCVYRQGHVKSGRMSVERVQLQAMPKADKTIKGAPNVRDLLQAEPGKGLWSLDLAQAELRVAAKYSGCNTMLKMLADGADLHSITCQEVLGVDKNDPNFKSKRDIAKRLTFASIFQVGALTFQSTLSKAGFHLPLTQCETLVRGWRNLYPEFGVAYRKAEKLMRERNYVKLLPNTESEVKSWLGERDYTHTAWSRMVQGSLAEFMKQWLIDVEDTFKNSMILTVHDSILLELPLMEGERIAKQATELGSNIAKQLFKTEMPIDIERWA